MDDKKLNDELEDDLSSSEFDEIYAEDDELLGDVSDEEIADIEAEASESDLDFLEGDIEEVFAEETEEVEDSSFSDDDDAAASDEDNEFPTYQNTPVKKKSSLGTIIMALLVVGGAGAGAYFSGVIPGFGPGNNTRSYQAPAAQQAAQTDTMAAEKVAVVEDAAADEDLENLYNESFSEADQYYEQPESSATDVTEDNGFIDDVEEGYNPAAQRPASATEELFADEQETAFADPLAEEEIQAVDVIEEDIALAEPAVPLSTDNGNGGASAAEIENLENQFSSLQSQLNNMQDSLDSRLSDLQNDMGSMNGSGSGSAPDLSGLRNDISGIQDTLSSFAARLDRMETKLDSELAEMNTAIEKVASSSKTAAPAPVKAQPAKAAPAPAPKKAASPKPSGVSASSWEIRAIQVGKAVIAKRNSGETRNIVAGDSVPGLGTIKEITYKNGGWIIQGSSGSIKQ